MRLAFILLCVSWQSERAPVPTPEQQSDKEKLVKEVFKNEYTRKAAAERIAFSKKLLQQAIETKDDLAVQYVLLRECRDIAASAGDYSTAVSAISELGKCFDVDPVRMKLAVLAGMAQETRLPDAAKGVAEALLKLVDEAATNEDLESVEKAAASAVAAAKKAKDVPLAFRSEARMREASQMKARLARVRTSEEVLSKDATDPAANFEVGRYLCFTKGNWDAGLLCLTKGSDEGLRCLAQKDLSNPALPQDQTALADSWNDLASKEAGARQRILDRAAFWYERALPAASGLLKTKIEKKLSEMAGGTSPKAAPQKAPILDDLVGWWKLDEASGSSAEDSSGHKNQGKLLGGTQWVPGHLGRALRFNGVDGQVVVDDAPSLRIVGDFTVACWFRQDASPTEWTRLVGKGTRQARNFGLWICAPFQGNVWMFQQWDGTGHELIAMVSKTQCENGRWYHLAAAVRGDRAALYVDGTEEATKKREGIPATSADPLILGYPQWDRPLAGVLDDVRVYRKGLSDAEIKTLASMK